MSAPGNPIAWLEKPGGQRVPVEGTCVLGRSPSSQIVVADEKVSRRHALIHAQERNEYWLVDLGSSNGTYLNGRRVTQPTRLRDQDRIAVSSFYFTFHQPAEQRDSEPTSSDKTIHDIKSAQCWLLVADIEGSTQFSQALALEEWPVLTGRWLAECKQLIEECGGCINKFLGDGFFAYWEAREKTAAPVLRALQALRRLQDDARPPFRVVLHHGQVLMGGGGSLGEESLLGKEVNFVFRMEKLASSLGEPRLLSELAASQLQAHLPGVEIGRHTLAGFDGDFLFFKF
jgi:adenylate cyclase